MLALVQFLVGLKTLVELKNGGQSNDVSRLLGYVSLGVKAGAKGKEYVQHAADVVTQLVKEDRALTDQELADLTASIEGKLARAAGVDLSGKTTTTSPAPVPQPDHPAGGVLEFPTL